MPIPIPRTAAATAPLSLASAQTSRTSVSNHRHLNRTTPSRSHGTVESFATSRPHPPRRLPGRFHRDDNGRPLPPRCTTDLTLFPPFWDSRTTGDDGLAPLLRPETRATRRTRRMRRMAEQRTRPFDPKFCRQFPLLHNRRLDPRSDSRIRQSRQRRLHDRSDEVTFVVVPRVASENVASPLWTLADVPPR